MSKHGAFFVYGGQAPKESWDIINNNDYKLRVKKTWVEATDCWHIEFYSQSVLDTRYEMFLTHAELKTLKDIL
jgi:hypothetical protein